MAVSVPSAVGNGGAGPSSVSTAGLLGLQDPELDDLKQAAISVIQQGQARAKHPKLTHNLFFDDGKGLSKIVQSFPKIRFHGKGREFDDLKLLIRHYEKWFKELLPCDDHFEDLVWKARTVLQEKERHDDGTISDPREQLHHIRLRYKTSSGLGTKGEEEKRAGVPAATGNGESSFSDEVRKRLEEKRSLDVETLWRIEEKRAKALELKRKRREEAAARGGLVGAGGPEGPEGGTQGRATSQTQSSRPSQEDVFGFGGGLDGSQSSAAVEAVARALSQTQSTTSQEDVFGFGGRFDGSQASSAASRRGAASLRALSQASDHDVFGFGLELDGSQASSAQPNGAVCGVPEAGPESGGERGAPLLTERATTGHVDISAELRSKIELNRQRALEVQRKRRQEEAAEKDGADAAGGIDLETLWKIEENRAKALEMRRKRKAQAAAKAGGLSQDGGSQTSVETKPTQPTQLERAGDASQSSLVSASQADASRLPATQQADGCVDPTLAAVASGREFALASEAPQSCGGPATDPLGDGPTQPPLEIQIPAPPELSLSAGDALAMSQLDVFGFGFDLDATQQAAPRMSGEPSWEPSWETDP